VTFDSSAWLWLLLLPVLLFLIYLLTHRPQPLTVSSERLWRGFSGLSAQRRRPKLPPASAALILGLLVLVGLALAAAGPWKVEEKPEPAIAVVVDLSPSMGVSEGSAGSRRIDLARQAALAILSEASATPYRLLLLAGGRVETVFSVPGDDSPFEAALSGSELSVHDVDLSRLTAAAAALVASKGGGRLTVISDFSGPRFRPPEFDEEEIALELVSVGHPAPNLALTSLAVSRLLTPDGRVEAVATVRNAGSRPATTSLDATLDGAGLQQTTLTLAAGERATWSFRVVPGGGQLLEVRMAPGGALAGDDLLSHRLPGVYSLRVQGDERPAPSIEAAVEVIAAGASGSRVSTPVALYFDRLPDSLPARWLYIAKPVRAPAGTPRPVALDIVEPGGEFLQRYDPILVPDLAEMPLAEPPRGSIPLALVAGRPAIAWVGDSASQGVWCGVPLATSDLARRGLLPLFLGDLLDLLDGGPQIDGRLLEDPDLSPQPPEGARDVAAVIDGARGRPVPLRRLGLKFVVLLVLAEALRRWLAARRQIGELCHRGAA